MTIRAESNYLKPLLGGIKKGVGRISA